MFELKCQVGKKAEILRSSKKNYNVIEKTGRKLMEAEKVYPCKKPLLQLHAIPDVLHVGKWFKYNKYLKIRKE